MGEADSTDTERLILYAHDNVTFIDAEVTINGQNAVEPQEPAIVWEKIRGAICLPQQWTVTEEQTKFYSSANSADVGA